MREVIVMFLLGVVFRLSEGVDLSGFVKVVALGARYFLFRTAEHHYL